ncbi:DUF3239 domain-containing protein [Corynebacterium sp. H78]|uniref:DUF3239 domain-containing protein n=1 Tax=Corynebacterium sp. H78 TaxID=3133417 RepID=UPI00309C0872
MSFTFPVDENHNKENNEYYRDGRRLKTSGIVFSILLLIAAGVMLWLGSAGWTLYLAIFLIVVGVFYLFVSVKLGSAVTAPQQLYDESPLCPAVIAEVEPRTMTLMALVDTRKDQNWGTPQRALTLRTVTKVSGVPRRRGARVPAVAVGGNHQENSASFDQVTPVPIAWGTRDTKVVREAERTIAHADWMLLQNNLDRVPDIRATKHDLLIID